MEREESTFGKRQPGRPVKPPNAIGFFLLKTRKNKNCVSKLFSRMANCSTIESFFHFKKKELLSSGEIQEMDTITPLFHIEFDLDTKKVRRLTTCYRSKDVESVCSIQPVWDGGTRTTSKVIVGRCDFMSIKLSITYR